ncbi:hypothetical protein ACFE04_012975 [Oxalis oulophora]
MASSPANPTPTETEPKTLIAQPINGHDSINPPPTDNDDITTTPIEKRKREDEVEEEQKPSIVDRKQHPLWKTSLCSYFRRQAGSLCNHGSDCRYAHSEEELRQRPDNTWDPSSDRAKKVMRNQNGDKCEVVKEHDIMMTEMVDDDDNDNDTGLTKCLLHLPMKWKSEELRSFLREQDVAFKSAKKKPGMAVGFVTFENQEQLEKAVEELQGKAVKNKTLKITDVISRSFEKKTSGSNGIDGNEDDSTPNGGVKTVCDAVTPLAHLPYSEQLEHKQNSLKQILKKLTRNARKACPNGVSLPGWILKAREIGGLPCKLEGIIESPMINGYRNKCEFSVGYSVQGKPTVGFMMGNFREGVTAVEEPTNCLNVSKISCRYASIFQEFLQDSGLPLWNRFKNTGFWRQLTVREGRVPNATNVENYEASISEVMIMVQVCSVGVDESLITNEFKRLAQAFAEGASANSPPLPLTALVIQEHNGISNAAPADCPLRQLQLTSIESEATNIISEVRINDYISNLKFSISPTAFFQVNTLAAEKLYSLAGDWAGLGPDTLLFDVCCGTGTIGLTLAHRVGMVVGIEMNASAVTDAYRNAEINGIKNCRFVSAKAEDVIGSLLKEYLTVMDEQDKDLNGSECVDTELIDAEKDNMTVDPKQESGDSKEIATSEGGDDELDVEKKTVEAEKGEGASGCVDNDRVEPKDKIENISTNGNSSVPQFKNIVAIVDPPRAGLHPIPSVTMRAVLLEIEGVIKALRTHSQLRRLVYISCNPETLVANAIELCTPSPDKAEKGKKDNRGWRNMSSAGLARHRAKSMPVSEPFAPVKSMAVDLFPHTPHCELVMLLER